MRYADRKTLAAEDDEIAVELVLVGIDVCPIPSQLPIVLRRFDLDLNPDFTRPIDRGELEHQVDNPGSGKRNLGESLAAHHVPIVDYVSPGQRAQKWKRIAPCRAGEGLGGEVLSRFDRDDARIVEQMS